MKVVPAYSGRDDFCKLREKYKKMNENIRKKSGQ